MTKRKKPRVVRPNKLYATKFEISTELLEATPSILGHLKRESLRALKVPKKTLRLIFKKNAIGWHGDGFLRNVKTVVFYYTIIAIKK